MSVEILAPGGSVDGIYAAMLHGADAIYTGTQRFSARAFADNPSVEQLCDVLDFAHVRDKKIYLTVNTLLTDEELEDHLYDLLLPLYDNGLDAVIVQDIGVMQFIHEAFPALDIHASTQMTIVTADGANQWKPYGVTRVVPARELSIGEIAQMRKHTDLEMEVFVHGALCYCYSGQCMMSQSIGGRSGNRGMCAQPCRLPYRLSSGKTGYYLSPKDMCTLGQVGELMDAGVDSFKIEGRMKTALYVATVARTYRKAIDDCMESPEKYHANMPWYQEQISNCTYRQFTTGFFYGKPDENTQIYDSNTYVREYTYLGFAEEIDERGLARLTQRNKFSVGETIEIMKPDGRNIPVTVEAIYNEEGESMESAPHAQQRIYVKLNETPEVFDILRRGE